MYHNKWNKKGVSPVIATILMVAITVVLAAVLYVMVIGFGGSGTQTPAGAFTSAENINANKEKLSTGTFNPETAWSQVKLVVTETTAAGVESTRTYTLSQAAASNNVTTTLVSGVAVSGCGVFANDLAADNRISNGDSITIQMNGAGFSSGYTYKLTILYTQTGAEVCAKTFSR